MQHYQWDMPVVHDGKVGYNTIKKNKYIFPVFWLAAFSMSWYKREYPLIGLAGLNISVTCVLLLSLQHLYFMETGYIVVNVRKSSWRLIYTSILKFLFVITVGQCKNLIIYKSKIVCCSWKTTWNIGMCDLNQKCVFAFKAW